MSSTSRRKKSKDSSSNSNTSSTSSSKPTLLSRRGRASPIALSAASSTAVRSNSNNANAVNNFLSLSSVNASDQQQQQQRKRPRTQKLYREDAQHHPSDIALTAANLAAGVLFRSGSNLSTSSYGNVNSNMSGSANASSATAVPSGRVARSSNQNTKKAMIGTTMPIHFAKPVFRNTNNASVDSVLRRKGVCLESDDEDDEDSPHRILLSLSKTPPTSFDERDAARRRANNIPYLLNAASAVASTDEQQQQQITRPSMSNIDENELLTHPSSPPQIQNAHRHFTSPGTIFFEPSPSCTSNLLLQALNTPTTSTLLEMAPSFSLFNPPSFDSLVGGEASASGGSNAPLFNLSMDMTQTNSKMSMSPRSSPLTTTTLYSTNNPNNSFSVSASGNVSDAMTGIGISDLNCSGGVVASIKPRLNSSKSEIKENFTSSSHHYSLTPVISAIEKAREPSNALVFEGESSSRLSPSSSSLPTPYQHLPKFYKILLTYRQCFEGFQFLLPGLQQCMSCPYGTFPSLDVLTERDLTLCKRRVRSAVCAFGGGCLPPNKSITNSDESKDSANATTKYESLLMKRFQESDSPEGRLSWDLEEEPPVEIPRNTYNSEQNQDTFSQFKDPDSAVDPSVEADSIVTTPSFRSSSNTTPATSNSNATISVNGSSSSGSKMRYRCKLCGQPKQNHSCPYNQTLQRSIGTQIYPAVNAYTSHEPGELTQNLIEMQTHSSYNLSSTADQTSSLPITSSDSTNSSCPPSTPFNPSKRIGVKVTPETPPLSSSKNAPSNGGSLFVEAVDLKPENYRVVTPFRSVSYNDEKSEEGKVPFHYPKIPLAYTQRKRLSDYLFSLTKEREGLTDETASVLRSGRENDSDYWDVCIAELLTQVIIVRHCESESRENSNDKIKAPDDSNNNPGKKSLQLLGLRKFLLQIGIAC